MKYIFKKILFFLMSPFIALLLCTIARKGDKILTLKAVLAQSVSFSEKERHRLSIIVISCMRRGSDSKGFGGSTLKRFDAIVQEDMYVWDYKKEFYVQKNGI